MSAQAAVAVGTGRALGRAMTRTLVTGPTVVAVDRNEGKLGELPKDARPEVVDTTDPAAAKSLIDPIVRGVGSLRCW